jgi:hypothetical protein
LILFAYSIIVAVEWDNFITLKTLETHAFNYMVINILLYVFGIGYNIVALILAKYYKCFIKGAYIFQMILVAFTIYGATLINTMYDLQRANKRYINMYGFFIWMLCIRFLIYLIICLFMVCLSFVVCVAIATG